MRIPKHPTLIRRLRDARVKHLVPRCPPLAASLGHNAAGGSHVTLKVQGKTRTIYVPKDLTEEVAASIREHKRLRQLTSQISALQLALIQTHLTAQKRRAGRD